MISFFLNIYSILSTPFDTCQGSNFVPNGFGGGSFFPYLQILSYPIQNETTLLALHKSFSLVFSPPTPNTGLCHGNLTTGDYCFLVPPSASTYMKKMSLSLFFLSLSSSFPSPYLLPFPYYTISFYFDFLATTSYTPKFLGSQTNIFPFSESFSHGPLLLNYRAINPPNFMFLFFFYNLTYNSFSIRVLESQQLNKF